MFVFLIHISTYARYPLLRLLQKQMAKWIILRLRINMVEFSTCEN